MAALRDGFALAKLSGESSLIGVKNGEKENEVIITSRTGFINIYQLTDQKLISSWSLRHGIQITCPTVWCPSREEYLTVQNSQQLKSWTSETVNFDKAKKKNIGSSIYRILIEGDHQPIIVCHNGQVDFRSNIKHSSSAGSLAEGESILWCQSYMREGSLHVILVTKTKDKSINVHQYQHQPETDTWSQKTSSFGRSVEDLISCCLSEKSELSLLTLWNSGQLLDTPLTNSCGLAESQEVANIGDVQASCSITSLDHTHVAVAGIKKDRQVGLGIYNIKFQALQTWLPFPEPVLTKPNLYCHRGHLFLACNKTLYAFPYHCEASTVARLLGQRDRVKDIHSPGDAVCGTVSWASDKKGSAASILRKKEKESQIVNLFSRLTSKEKKLSQKLFAESFRKMMKLLSEAANFYWVSSAHMSNLCRTCFTMTAFWPREQIEELIEKGYISHSDQACMFEALADHNEISLIHKAFSILPDVAESSIVRCLQCYLDRSDEEFSRECENLPLPSVDSTSDDSSDDPQCPVCIQKSFLLNPILSLPFNDVFLVECLRKLSFKNVLILLDYLYYLLRVVPMVPAGKSETLFPPLTKVIDWVALLIDAHVTQLIVSTDARMLLGNLHEAVTEQVDFCNQLSSLEAILARLKEKCTPVSQHKVGIYCIEVLHVR